MAFVNGFLCQKRAKPHLIRYGFDEELYIKGYVEVLFIHAEKLVNTHAKNFRECLEFKIGNKSELTFKL